MRKLDSLHVYFAYIPTESSFLNAATCFLFRTIKFPVWYSRTNIHSLQASQENHFSNYFFLYLTSQLNFHIFAHFNKNALKFTFVCMFFIILKLKTQNLLIYDGKGSSAQCLHPTILNKEICLPSFIM